MVREAIATMPQELDERLSRACTACTILMRIPLIKIITLTIIKIIIIIIIIVITITISITIKVSIIINNNNSCVLLEMVVLG